MARLFFLLSLSLILFVVPATTFAETRYVSDQLVITLRTAKSDQAKIIKTLKTDTPVEVLSEEGAYLKVREPGGEVGFVLKHYISRERPKPVVIKQLRNEIQTLKNDLEGCLSNLTLDKDRFEESIENYREQVATLEAQVASLEQDEESTAAALEDVRTAYENLKAKSENVVALATENERLQTEHTQLSRQNQVLKEQNQSLMIRGIVQWFLAGGGVFFVGWICGKISRRKRSGYLS